jgi:hypothetical protein
MLCRRHAAKLLLHRRNLFDCSGRHPLIPSARRPGAVVAELQERCFD